MTVSGGLYGLVSAVPHVKILKLLHGFSDLNLHGSDEILYAEDSELGGKTQALAFGGGSAQASTADSKPIRAWVPSQKGLFSDCPQRHRPITARPAKSKVLPSPSSMVKEPSMRNEPLLRTMIFVLAMSY